MSLESKQQFRAKLPQIISFVTCLSETDLDLSILHDNDNLQIPGYNLGKIIPETLNEEVLAFTNKFLFHLELKISITCTNA